MSARIVPGVTVQVIKEIVPQQLYPSGVVGMIGTADKGPIGIPVAVTSYQEIKDIFLETTPSSLVREAKNAFQNGVFQIVATRVAAAPSGGPRSITLTAGKKNRDVIRLTAKDSVDSAVDVKVMRGQTDNTVRIELLKGNAKEEYENLTMLTTDPLYLVNTINQSSKWVTVESLQPDTTADNNPNPQEVSIAAPALGAPTKETYENALQALELETAIDVVYVCENSDPEIHALVDAHCQNMSLGKEPKPLGPRIGIGTVGKNESVDDIAKRTEALASDRFILVAPYGMAGAVAGLISKLNYYESPTFKALTGIGPADIDRRYRPSEQMTLLKNGILPVDAVKGRGIIIVKGITTSKEQISVMRISDHSVRGIKNICDMFIGTLNNARNRMALRERITEFMIGMEREGAIVPSTDNTKPAYVVDVYSSQPDFAQGIVRVDSAVRPVRAIDYIYATINVQAF